MGRRTGNSEVSLSERLTRSLTGGRSRVSSPPYQQITKIHTDFVALKMPHAPILFCIPQIPFSPQCSIERIINAERQSGLNAIVCFLKALSWTVPHGVSGQQWLAWKKISPCYSPQAPPHMVSKWEQKRWFRPSKAISRCLRTQAHITALIYTWFTVWKLSS